jgi:hypothetical protein
MAACHDFAARGRNKTRRKFVAKSERWLAPAKFLVARWDDELKELISLI